ncbi:MAG: penicillin acylase family protein [Gemmataceae bacterium]
MKPWGLALQKVAAVVGKAGVRRWLLKKGLPPKEEIVSITGLRGDVEVRFDAWGVPHIRASWDIDLFFAQGYCHARDRLWQMELNRRLATGELAEIFGPRLLDVDRFLRRFGFRRQAEREVQNTDGELREIGEAYVAGIHAYLNRHPLPVEFQLLRVRPRPWTVTETLAFARFMAFNLAFNWETELVRARLIAELGPERVARLENGHCAAGVPRHDGPTPTDALAAALAFQPMVAFMGGGSNNWVARGERTTTGRPLMANDPHLRPRMPAVWYFNHLQGAGYNVIGGTFPGTLGVLVGHNERIAWSVTAGLVDTQDLYVEKPHPDRPGWFAWGDDWYEAETVREEYRVRGQAEPFVEETYWTRHGPILNGILDIPTHSAPLAIRGTMDDALSPTRGLLALCRASDWTSFRQALAHWTFPVLNFLYADVDGHIGYKMAGHVPRRAQGDGFVPMPGWSGDHEWDEPVPFDDMPEVFDPPEGIFATANTRPDCPCPHFLARDWVDDSRWRRIMQLLRGKQRHSLADFQAMQMDVVSLPAQIIVDKLRRLGVADPPLQQARQLLAGWDGDLTPDSVPAAIYAVFRRQLLRRLNQDMPEHLLNHVLGQGINKVLGMVSVYHHHMSSYLLHQIEALADDAPELRDALADTVEWLTRELGPDPARWQWGRLHQIQFTHPIGLAVPTLDKMLNLSRGPYPLGGDADTVAQAGIDPWQPFAAVAFTVSCRLLFDVGDWDQCRFVLPIGQSGHPGSPHYDDMIQSWLTGEQFPLLFSRAAVEAHTRERIEMKAEEEDE